MGVYLEQRKEGSDSQKLGRTVRQLSTNPVNDPFFHAYHGIPISLSLAYLNGLKHIVNLAKLVFQDSLLARPGKQMCIQSSVWLLPLGTLLQRG